MRLSRRRRIQSPQPEQLEQRALLTAGDVLTSFGQNGFLELPGGQQPIVQPDGKTVTVGYDSDLQQIVLTRFESDGALDLSFGSNGRALIPGGGSTFTTLATEMADGSILVWSQGRFQINQASTAPRFVQVFGFYRLSADGQLDSSFGDGGFLVQAGFTGRRVLRDLTATPDGKVLGTFLEEPPSGSPDASDRPALIRFNSDGTIDQSFGNHGIAELGETIDIGGRNVMRTVLQPDGKTLIAANEFVNTPTFNDDFLNVIVMRANADGSVDTTFGDDGRSIFRIGSGYGDEVVDLHLRSDGKIVVVAQNEPSRSSTAADLAFARLTPDGQLDTSFSGDGKLVVFNTSGVSGSFISDNDKITTIDTLSERVELQRFNSDGTPDVSFGTNGIATLTGEYGGPLYELPDTTIIATVAFFASGPDGVVAFEGDGGSGAFQFDAESIAIDEAAGSATVLVTRRNGTDGRATVIAETTTSGSSATAGDDYVETSETLVFENGESVKTITVPIVDSVPTEGTESISLRLRQPTDGSSLGTQSTSRIDIIDQAGTINFTEAVYLAQESLPTGTLTFTRTDGFAGTIQADIRVVGGSATAGLDFETPTQRVRFTDGQRTATIDITMLDDDLEEGPEFATLELINPTNGAAIGSGTARLQILDAEAGVGQNPGALDRHFGVDGQVVAELDGSQFTTSMARQPDGKIVVAGSHTPVSGNGEATSREFGLTRFNEEGSIDTSFGIDGLASVGFGGDASDLINDIALQQDGKIVAVGTTEDGLSRFAIARFNADGTLDTSFGDDGLITEDFKNFASANAVAIDSEGRIIVVGSTGDVFSHGFAIARYQPNGRLDTSFGEGGLVTTNIEINTLGRGPILGQFSTASDVAILADDRIVVGGTQESAQAFDRSILSVANFVFAQYNVDGTLDPTFGFDGIILHDTNGGVEPDDGASNNADRLNTMEVDSEGRIIAAGQSDGDFVVARFRPDGQIDESFGFLSGFQATGIQQASTGFQFRDEVNAVGFLPDGDLILVGQASFSRFGAVRLQENGFYQESFGADAVVQHSISRAIDTTVLPDGRVLSAVQTPGDFGLAQIITETDCPLAGCVQFATVGFVANEDSGTATITVSRDPRTTAGAVTVDYAAVAGTATADEDFIETSGTLSFADGQQSATFEVELIDDDISEGTVRGFGTRTDETVQLSLSNPTGGAFLGSTNVVQLAIVDDEQPELDFGIFTSAVQENAGVAVVTVTRRQLNGIAPDEPASVDFTVIDGTATAGLDFEPLLGTISFAPQQETATIEIPLIADTEIEGEEAFTVQLSNPQGGLLRRGDTATVRLLDTDPTTFENAGQLWRPFGNDGIIRQGFNGSPEYVNDAVQLEDGSVLVAARLGDVSDFEILKYNPDGSLDTDFGQFGRAEKYDQRERNEAQAVRVLDDGKIMAAGYSWDGLVRSFVLVRYNADGTLDETFGNEGVQFHTIAWWASSFDDVKIGSDGSVWFNGSIRDSKDSGSTNAIVRFGSDGEVDPQFGDDGVIYVAQAFGIRFPSTAAANDGGLLLLGAGEGTTELIKINEQGLLDTSFGDNGFASYPDIDGVFSSSSVLQVLPDGSVLSDRQAFSEDFTEVIQRLVKFLPNGEPDDAFGDGGLAEWNAPLRVEGVAVEADGRIVLSGQALGSSAAYRIYPNGDRDTGFGQDGLTVIAQSGSAERVFVAEDGRLLLIGETSNDLLLAQLRGGPDPGSFQFDSGQFEISEAAGSITIPVQRVAGADGTVRVTVRTRESDSAVEGRDYEGVTQTLRFEDRQLTSEITIPITDDDAAEGNLSFIVELINPTNDATLNALSSAEVTIIDDESPGKFQFTSSSEFVGEGEGTAAITVERISGNGGRATVQVVSADGSATEGEDYSAVIETLVFEDGVTSQTFFVTVTNDAAEEPDETITLTLENPTGGAELAFREQMRVTIVDNDGETDEATIRIADSRVVESDDGEQFIEFEVTRSDNEGAPSVSWTTADGTATAGEDYEQTSGTVAFTDGGDLTQTVRVPVLGDTLVERDETFIVRLSDAVDAVINDDQATGTIEDDDSATISIGDISLTEGDSGSRVFRFEISVDAEIDQPVTFNATTVDGTASSNDYSANDDSLSIQTSDTNTMFEVTVFGDTNFEPDETFFVNLSGLNAGGRDVTFATAQSLGTILNDDEDNGDTNPCSEVRPDDGAFLTDDGTLFIVGTGGSDVLRTSERRKRLYTWVNRDRESWNPDEVDRIVMCGFDGRDRVKRSGASRSRHAFMDGGDGYDFLRGGTGSDTIHGGDGRDTLIGGKGDDELHGGRGDDRLRGQHGQDLLDGGGGNDRLYGGNGSDVVLGGTGSDSVLGNGGHDLLIGGNDRDTVKGGGGHDLVIGGAVSLPVPDLRDILDEWTESGRSVEQRIANIRGDNPSNDRHNEVAFLNVDSIADDARDILFGCGGTDWFFASVDDHVKDQRDFEQLDTV